MGDPDDEYEFVEQVYPEYEPSVLDLHMALADLAKRGEPAHVLLTSAVIEEELERLLLSSMR